MASGFTRAGPSIPESPSAPLSSPWLPVLEAGCPILKWGQFKDCAFGPPATGPDPVEGGASECAARGAAAWPPCRPQRGGLLPEDPQ